MNARPRHATPQLALAAGFLLAGLCSGMGGEALRRALPGPSGDLLATLGLQGFLFCLAFAGEALLRPTMPGGLALGPGRIRATTVLILVVGFVVLSHGVSVALAWLSLREAGTLGEIDRIVRASRAGPALPLVLLAIGLSPAFGEELMFRGLIQGGVSARWGPRIAIAVSAAAFAILHGDWVHGSAAFLLGQCAGGHGLPRHQQHVRRALPRCRLATGRAAGCDPAAPADPHRRCSAALGLAQGKRPRGDSSDTDRRPTIEVRAMPISLRELRDVRRSFGTADR